VEPLSKADQIVLAVVIGVVGLLVVVALRATKPGAPARMGAIVAGLMLLLTLIVGLRAHDVTAPRSDQTPGVASSAVAPLRPSAVEALDGAEFTGDPQTGLTIQATSADATVHSAYLPDSKVCDGQVDADITQAAPGPDTAVVSATGSPAAAVGPTPASAADPSAAASPAPAATPDYGFLLAVRVPPSATASDGLLVEYRPALHEVRLTSAAGTTTMPGTGAVGDEAHLRVAVSGQNARVWLGNQLVTAAPVAVTDGCAAIRFGAWGAPATLRALTIQAS
jgi:hypothetical protein